MEEIEAEGQRVEALENQPIMIDYLEYYINAFSILDTCRQFTALGSALPITMSEMYSYMKSYGVDDVETFVHHMKIMDVAYLEHLASKEETNG